MRELKQILFLFISITGSDAFVRILNLCGNFGIERTLHLQESTRNEEQNNGRNICNVQTTILSVNESQNVVNVRLLALESKRERETDKSIRMFLEYFHD